MVQNDSHIDPIEAENLLKLRNLPLGDVLLEMGLIKDEQLKELLDAQKGQGVRLGELVMVTSGSGMGKTQWMRELKDHYHRTTDFKFGDIALEEDVGQNGDR